MGTVRADNFSDGAGTGAPDFATGIKASGGFDTAGGAGLATTSNPGLAPAISHRYCWMYSNVAQNGNADGATVIKSFHATDGDVHSMADLVNNRIVPDVEGIYAVSFSCAFTGTINTIISYNATILKNGVSPGFNGATIQNNGTSNIGAISSIKVTGSGIMAFNGTTDYIDMHCGCDTTGTTWGLDAGGQTSTYITIARISPLPIL